MFLASPVDEAMAVKSVVDTLASLRMKPKPHLGCAVIDALLVDLDLFRCDVELGCQVLNRILAALRHVRVEFKRLQMDFNGGVGHANCGFKRGVTNRAPGARHIRHQINTDWLVQTRSPVPLATKSSGCSEIRRSFCQWLQRTPLHPTPECCDRGVAPMRDK